MELKVISIVGILALFSGIEAQNGVPCHASFFQFTPRHSLNISRYMGDWYMHEIASSDIGNFPVPDFKCARRTLSLPSSGNLLNIDATDTFVNITDGNFISDGPKQISVNDTRSPLSSMWQMESGEDGEVKTQVIIMAADLEFQQWTIVYSCSHRGPEMYRYEVTMAMTRSRTITPELRQFLKALMVGLGFRIGDHFPIDQMGC